MVSPLPTKTTQKNRPMTDLPAIVRRWMADRSSHYYGLSEAQAGRVWDFEAAFVTTCTEDCRAGRCETRLAA